MKTADGVLLKREAEARAQAQAQAQAAAASITGGGAVPPLPPAVQDAAPRKSVPAVQVAWGDLHAAVQAGWIRPEAAHALWARWLARKPLTHVEDDGEPLAALPPLPPDVPSAREASSQVSSTTEAPPPSATHPPEGPPTSSLVDPTVAESSDRPAPERPPQLLDMQAQPAREVPGEGVQGPADEPPREAQPEQESPAREAEPVPEPVDVEVLEPLDEANARRAAERAAQPAPVIQVTDVIEALPERPPPAPATAPGWVLGQCLIALLAAALTAVSVGLGHQLFGPSGAALAALFWTVVVWRKTTAYQAAGQGLRAVLGAHLVLPLLALTVWQVQEAAGWWPAARPLDLFADAPLDTLSRAAPGLQLDWRWLALAGIPLAAAVTWLIRLRRPVMLGAVTALLWVVTFQAVAGVLQALGLAFHGMTVFMLLLGGLTLLGGIYIDLKSREARVADFARWPYWCGAALLGAGWLSLSVVPGPLVALRYAGWLLFLALSLSLARPSLVALAVALVGAELSIHLGRAWGSDLMGVAVWLAWLGLTATLLLWLLPRAGVWARRWQFWMPRTWREALARPAPDEAAPVPPRRGT